MYYKVSNIATVNTIESLYGAKFRFPHLHTQEAFIDGLNEEILPIITAQKPHEINFGIWGIMPQDYRDDWSVFQKTRNTLNMDVRDIYSEEQYLDALKNRRCNVLVTGFFASFNFEGQVYPVYVHADPVKPLCLAGIYNVSNDGFYNFSLVLVKNNEFMNQIHNIGNTMPLVMDEYNCDMWLNDNEYEILLDQTEYSTKHMQLTSHTIAKEFYKNNIVFNNILEPAIYKKLVTNS